MAEIPAPVITKEDLYEWYRLRDQIAKLRQQEHFLRMKIIGVLYPTPKEGTNNYDLGTIDPKSNGFVLKMKYQFNRKVDKALFEQIKEPMRKLGVNPDLLVRYTPELETKKWRELTAEQQAFFNQCLDIKLESPQLTLEPTAEKKKELEAAKAGSAKPLTDISDLTIPSLTGK